jgi:hypothetical protein
MKTLYRFMMLVPLIYACQDNNTSTSTRKKMVEDQYINTFFANYEKNFNDALSGKDTHIVDKVIRSFADCFVESSPLGVSCGKNDSQFIGGIRQGFEFYKKIGTQSMHILAKEVTVLDAYHSMVKIKWQYKAIKQNKEPVEIVFDIYYFLRAVNHEHKIFAYIAGDEQKVLKEHGLIPEQ